MNNKLICCVTIIGLCCSGVLASPAGQVNGLLVVVVFLVDFGIDNAKRVLSL